MPKGGDTLIQIDMLKKKDIRIPNKAFHLENNSLTLSIELLNYTIDGKIITASFEPARIETGALEISDGVILIPIHSNMVKIGINYIQLNIRWDGNKLEQSPKMLWQIDKSLETDGAAPEDVDLISYLVSIATQAKVDADDALAEANRVVDVAGDVRIALDNSTDSANNAKFEIEESTRQANNAKSNLDGSINLGSNTKRDLDESISRAVEINDVLSDEVIGTIKIANNSKVALEGSIIESGTAKSALDDSIGLASTEKTALDESIGLSNTKKSDLDDSIGVANTINNTLTDIVDGTIKKATDINIELEDNISTGEVLKGDIEQSIIDNQIVKKNDFNSHLSTNMPHQFQDLKNSKTYRFGFQISIEGKPQIIYEEVIL